MESTIQLARNEAPRLRSAPQARPRTGHELDALVDTHSIPLPDFMPTRRRLLCVTDLTVRSERAMQRTAQLAQQMNAETHFVHAVSDKLSGRVLRMKVARAYVRLTSESMRVMKHAPDDVTAAVQLGKPLEVVIAAAREYAPDLIVMARPKRRKLDAMIGTTAERIIRSTGRSVLLVGGMAERAYERVILATDLSSKSTHVTRTAVSMGLLKNVDVCVVHAYGPLYHEFATDHLNYFEPGAGQQDWHVAVRRDVLRSLENTGIDPSRVHVSTEQASPLTAIQRAMDQEQPALLVIGVSRWFALKRMVIGSVADKVFRSVDGDVLAVAPSPLEKKWLHAA